MSKNCRAESAPDERPPAARFRRARRCNSAHPYFVGRIRSLHQADRSCCRRPAGHHDDRRQRRQPPAAAVSRLLAPLLWSDRRDPRCLPDAFEMHSCICQHHAAVRLNGPDCRLQRAARTVLPVPPSRADAAALSENAFHRLKHVPNMLFLVSLHPFVSPITPNISISLLYRYSIGSRGRFTVPARDAAFPCHFLRHCRDARRRQSRSYSVSGQRCRRRTGLRCGRGSRAWSFPGCPPG